MTANSGPKSASKIVSGLNLDAVAPAGRGRRVQYAVPADFVDSLKAMYEAGKGVYYTPSVSQEHAAALIRRARDWGKADNTREVSTFAADGRLASGAGAKRQKGTEKVVVGITARKVTVQVH